MLSLRHIWEYSKSGEEIFDVLKFTLPLADFSSMRPKGGPHRVNTCRLAISRGINSIDPQTKSAGVLISLSWPHEFVYWPFRASSRSGRGEMERDNNGQRNCPALRSGDNGTKQTFPGTEKSPTFRWLSRLANFQQEQDPHEGERTSSRKIRKTSNPLRLLTLCSAIMKEKGT